jgi:O-antigen ligase
MNTIFTSRTYKAYVNVFLFIYSIIYFLYHLTGFNIFKNFTNLLSVVTIIYTYFCLFYYSSVNGLKRSDFFSLIVTIFLFLIHFLLNFGHTDVLDLLKLSFIIISTLYFFSIEKIIINNKLIIFMMLLPVFLQALGGSRVYDPTVSFGFFQNENTAYLYFVALIGILIDNFKTDKYYLSYAFLALSFQKMGALISSIIALSIVYFRFFFRYIYILSFIVIIMLFFLYKIGSLERFLTVADGLYIVFSQYSLSEVSTLSYENLVYLTGSTDISALFRIKHWSEIIEYYITSGPKSWLFGIGARESVNITTKGLVPHNDYLRVLAEFGLLIFISWINIYISFLKNISNANVKSVCLILLIYYFSENLIDGFVTMYLLHILMAQGHDGRKYLGKYRHV